jgi:ribosome biogenesis protein Nip4
LVNSDLNKIWKQTRHPISFIGIFLGKKKKNFIPSPYLLAKLAKVSKNKVSVNDKGAWMFICGKHIYAKSITKFNPKQRFNDVILITNQYNECLGYGKMINKFDSKKVAIQNHFDIGDFVRRERKRY